MHQKNKPSYEVSLELLKKLEEKIFPKHPNDAEGMITVEEFSNQEKLSCEVCGCPIIKGGKK